MRIKTIVTGVARENTYIISDDSETYCILVDPGDNIDKIISGIDKCACTPMAILLTHCHFDHVISVNPLKEQYNIPVYAHVDEIELAENPEYNKSEEFLGYSISVNVDNPISNSRIKIEQFSFDVIHTPGHTKGCVCYYFYDKGIVFTGDTLFRGSVGRTDLPLAQPNMLVPSIRNGLLSLPSETIVYPGHGMKTTIEYEKENNPFFV